jgi:hypothetical protein
MVRNLAVSGPPDEALMGSPELSELATRSPDTKDGKGIGCLSHEYIK